MKKETITILGILKSLVQGVLSLILHLIKVIYLIVKGFDTLVGRLFNKLPRTIKVITIYSLVVLSVLAILLLTNQVNF